MGSGKVIRKVLVANRGEIAIRIARTCREMAVATVVAHAEDDRNPFVLRAFDETVSLGTGDVRETYLNIGKIIDAARQSGADAIHPGYGFLSERPAFAAACEEADITFIGPRASSIELMGSKSESRKLMEKLGVPVIPGYHGDDQSDERLKHEAERLGFPLLVKASAGGGGKGMKVVRSLDEAQHAIESARREALKSFGDDRLLLERYIEHPRHVEFQVFGDSHGNLVHLFERDCSVQRRHQKVIEESPAPNYPEDLRARMAKSAIAAAAGVEYRNAGTVECIVTPAGEYYFLEMNTRLQVEHPVTEMVTGVDLVRAQIEVASGKPLPWKQEDLEHRGHAIECRIYAEDPEDRFLPQIGTVAVYREPAGPGVRVDSGIGDGSVVTVHFDPMLAKLAAYGETRSAAIGRLDRALREFVILGTKTNASYLRRVVTHPEFAAGNVSTAFLTEHEDDLRSVVPDDTAAIAAILATRRRRGGQPLPSPGAAMAKIPSVWDSLGEWKM